LIFILLLFFFVLIYLFVIGELSDIGRAQLRALGTLLRKQYIE
jgi:hypothetical protein